MSLVEPGSALRSAEQYRELAAQCQDLAQRMSLKTDKARMLEMAQQWLAMAEAAERTRGAP